MKNFFITNSEAGLGEANASLIRRIEAYPDCVAYTSTKAGDSMRIASMICNENKGEMIRIFACGGDGTLNEVVNGVLDFDNVQVGCMPFGKGNDFVRNFAEVSDFRNIENLLEGKTRKIDLIQYETLLNGRVSPGYMVNMLNIGLDCNAVYGVWQLKNSSILKGKMPYIVISIKSLVRKDGENLSIHINGNTFYNGKVILMTAANGCYCGGNVIFNAKTNETLIKANNGTFRICIDGEISYAEKIKLKICSDILSFILPFK
ncbi:MAG: diacylglycerol kinase family protein [Eubacteriales bacterium]|nr:diacylglycerol kinase family protein [Eubacteriales bacterium]MDD4389859.1 diacylglycerol kinase family protein [Eubacteriales bacterium]